MKRLLLIFSTLVFFSINANAQARTEQKVMELIMEIPKADAAKSLKAISKKIAALPEVSIQGFCNSKKLLMLKLNPQEYFNVLIAVDEAGFTYYIKRDLQIAEVMSACNKGDLYTSESLDSE